MKKMMIIISLILLGNSIHAQQKPSVVNHKKKVGVKPNVLLPVYPQRVIIQTDSGNIIIRLFDKTPLHRDNFIKLVKEHYYDSMLFHRVIQTFMIQGGDPDSKASKSGQLLGNGGPGYRIHAEIDTSLFHKRGVVAAARESDQVNPLKESSGSQFYIVQGKVYTDSAMDVFEMKRHIYIPPSHRAVYKTIGGTPQLDMNYTVFGELESGIEVVDKIASAAKDQNNRPLKDVRMTISVLPQPVLPASLPKSKLKKK